MSYCPHCDKSVEIEQKTKVGKGIAKGAVSTAGASVNLAMKISDDSHYETDKNQMLNSHARHNRAVRNSQSDAAVSIMNSMNNKSVDLAMGADHYYACMECHSVVDHPQCESRPEYLGVSYDASTNNTQKILAGILLIGTYALLKDVGISKVAVSLSSIGAAIIGYFGVNFIPLKPRGIVNLLGENVKSVFVVSITFVIALLIGGFAIEAMTDKGLLRDILISTYMILLGGGSLYGLFTMNKRKWSEIKETWMLLDQLDDNYQAEDVNHDQAA